MSPLSVASTEVLIKTDAVQMAQLLDSLPQFIGLLDPDGTIRYLNRAPIEAAGLPEEKLIGIKFWDSYWWQGGDHERLKREIAEAAKGTIVRREARVLTKNGMIDIDFILTPIRDKDGTVVWITAEGRNITEQKRVSRALSENERLLRQVIDLVPLFIFAKNREGRFILVNKAVADAYGTTVGNLIGKTDADFAKSSEEVANFRADDLAVIDSGKPKWIPEEPITHADGKLHFLSTVKIPFDFSGTPAVLGVSMDITEKKLLWEEAQKNQRIASLGILAGGIAHDFNNLLGTIFGFIDLARHITREPQTRHYLDEAMQALARARGLTRQLLTFAKGGAPFRRIAPLAPLIRETVSFTLSGSTVTAAYNLPDDLPPCPHDPDQMTQVITNLVINAQQAMPTGGTIEIDGTVVSLSGNEVGALPAGRYLRLSFRDNGVGIPPAILPHIFDPFFTTKQKGSGLGLSIAHSIVTRHGGTITVTSEVNEGATFTIYLPVEGEAPFAQRREKEAVPFHRGSGRILVMDDDATMLRVLAAMLGQLGYEVTSTRDGDEALETFLAAHKGHIPFLAIFLDLTVPGATGGRETAANIRKHDATIPIFVVSGYGNDPVMADPQKHGFTDSLAKPYTIEDLSRLLERNLSCPPPALKS